MNEQPIAATTEIGPAPSQCIVDAISRVAKNGRTGPVWKWVVRCFYRDGSLAIETVHKSDFSKQIEVEAARERLDIERIDVLDWIAAGMPQPRSR